MIRIAPRAGRLIRREGLPLWGLACCVLVVIAFLAVRSGTRGARYAISGGSAAGIRHHFAEVLAEESAEQGLRLRVVATSGSLDALHRLSAGLLDFALIQGGLTHRRDQKIRQLTALQVEPLHLLVRSGLEREVGASLLALRGLRVNVGTRGSGTRRLAEAVLRFADVYDEGVRPILSDLSYRELLAADTAQALPDAVFSVSSLPSPVARQLVTRWGYRLVPLDFADSFAIAGGEALGREPTERRAVDPRHVGPVWIPTALYDRSPPVPAQGVPTLGARLLLLSRAGVPEDVAYRLLHTVFETRFARVAHEPLDPSLLLEAPELPYHAGAQRFRRRDLPILTGETLSILDATLNIAAPTLGGALFLWTWLRQSRRRRRETSFKAYVRRVNEIEREALTIERADHTPIERLIDLQRDLTEMKTEAMERFARGEVQDKEVLTGFVSLVKDARDYVTRLIAQERALRRARRPGPPIARTGSV